MQQVSVLETNIGSSTTGNSSNGQVIFNDNGTLRGDADMTFNTALNKFIVSSLEVSTTATITGNLTAAAVIPSGSTVPTNGLYLPTANNLGFAYNSTLGMTLNSTGLGIGATPSAWPAASKAIDVDTYGANYAIAAATQVGISRNCYYNGTNWIYKLNTSAQRFEQDNGGGFKWFTAAAGSAGTAISPFTQAMTLAANGQLLLGTSTTDGAIDIGMVLNKPSATGFVGNVYQFNGSSKAYTYITSAAAAFRVDTVTGYTINMVSDTNGVYLANGGTSWTALSDERFKDIIEPISNAVAKVGSIRSVIGKFKTESEGTRRSFLIAQDVQAVLPEAVDASNPEKLGVSYTEVIPLLVAAIKELTAEVNALKNA